MIYLTQIYLTHPFSLLDPFSGGSGDWARGVARIKYAVAMELRDSVSPSNYNNDGFSIPPSNIVPTGEEVFAAIKVDQSKLILVL